MKLLAFNFSLLTQHQLIPYWFPCTTKCAPRTLPLCSANRHWTARAHMLVYRAFWWVIWTRSCIFFSSVWYSFFLKSEISVLHILGNWDSKCIWEVTHMAFAWRGAQLHIQTPAGTWCFSLFICAPEGFMFGCFLWKCSVLPQKKDSSRSSYQSFGYCNA